MMHPHAISSGQQSSALTSAVCKRCTIWGLSVSGSLRASISICTKNFMISDNTANIPVINKRIQENDSVPNAHFNFVKLKKLLLLLKHKIIVLVDVILVVEFGNSILKW